MKKIILVFLMAIFANAGEISVAAAANTAYAFDELKSEFNKIYPDIKVNVSLGSSGALSTQIRNGAPFDIFMAADMKFASDIFKDGLGVSDAKVYAKGKLAMFSIRNFDLKKGLEILKDDSLKTIAVANPKTAPYGAATMQAFEKAGILKEVESKIVQAKSIGDTLSQALSAADIGFVAASAMYSKEEYKEGVNFVLVDSSLYEPIAQGVVLLKKAEENADAKVFYEFILSQNAKEIFKKYGYDF